MQKLFKNPQTAFWLLLVLVAMALMLPNIMSRGMFLDGVTYATVSRNLAEGHGSFWMPFYTDTLYPHFFEHPPLVFGIESVFFRVFGNGYFVEKFYSLLTFLVTGWLILKIWKLVLADEASPSKWLPLLLWVITPLVYWTYVNNMLENTMDIFCLGSIAILLYGWETEKRKILIWFASGLLIFGGLLCKGPFALFPLAIPFLYWLILRSIKFGEVIISTTVISAVLCIGLMLLWQYPPARNNLNGYLHVQLLASLNGKREHVTGSHFVLLKDLGSQLIPIFILLACTWGASKIWKGSGIKINIRVAMFFLLTGMAASFPVMISPKQMIHYVIGSIPFYGMAAAVVLLPYVQYLASKIRINSRGFKWVNYGLLTGILLVMLVSVTLINTNGRDEVLLDDLENMETDLPVGGRINCNSRMYYNWQVHAYLYRFYHVSLDDKNIDSGYFLTDKEHEDEVPAGYVPFNNSNLKFLLYRRMH
jgi:4-amino-4-deoxy-L-arabinose transferase-like glycosyltransferase